MLINLSKQIPIVSIGDSILGISKVLSDSYSGMSKIVKHIVVEHSKKHIAYLGGPPGNPEAAVRLDAYKAEL